MGARPQAALAVLATTLALAAPALADQRLTTIDTPSKYVDVKTAVFNGTPPTVLKANVLLPDGYDADTTRRWPVLYLLHGVGDSYDTWAKPERGDIKEVAKGFPGIIVMPEAGKGFYTDWYNGGKRGDPAWERYYTRELMPQIAKQFRIAPGRRNHAIAGLSMGGMGATYLGSQRPDYFGTVATFSGFVEHQRQTVKAGFGAVAGVDYEAIFGPIDGPYASGHNPTKLVANLRNTPVFDAAGNGVADPAESSSPSAIAGGGAVEAEIGQENAEFAAAAQAAGVQIEYRPGLGIHDWPYWRKYLREAIAWGLFRDGVVDDPARWSYTTIATSGRMWSLRYRFTAPPADLVTFERDGDTLRGSGVGTVVISSEGCEFQAALPFERALPSVAAGDACGRLHVSVAPRQVRRGGRSTLRVRVTRSTAGGHAFPVADALVRVGRTEAHTDAGGRATLRHRFASYLGARSVRVQAPGLGRTLVALRVR